LRGGKKLKKEKKKELKVAARLVIKTRIAVFRKSELRFWRWEGKKSKQLAWG